MPICPECGDKFPNRIIINGIERIVHKRVFCLKCSPFGTRHRCGPKLRCGVRIKGRPFNTKCYLCNKVYITKNAQHTCSACRSKLRRDEMRSKAQAMLGGKCIVCGYSKYHGALEFHHKDGKKEANVSELLLHRWKKIESELKKNFLLT